MSEDINQGSNAQNSTMAVLLREKQKELDLSDRQLAGMVGIAHTTLPRIWEGKAVDIVTIRKVADFLGVESTTLLSTEGLEPDSLANKIALVLETEPKLARSFGEAMERVLSGKASPRLVRELATYAAYLLSFEREDAGSSDDEREEEKRP